LPTLGLNVCWEFSKSNLLEFCFYIYFIFAKERFIYLCFNCCLSFFLFYISQTMRVYKNHSQKNSFRNKNFPNYSLFLSLSLTHTTHNTHTHSLSLTHKGSLTHSHTHTRLSLSFLFEMLKVKQSFGLRENDLHKFIRYWPQDTMPNQFEKLDNLYTYILTEPWLL